MLLLISIMIQSASCEKNEPKPEPEPEPEVELEPVLTIFDTMVGEYQGISWYETVNAVYDSIGNYSFIIDTTITPVTWKVEYADSQIVKIIGAPSFYVTYYPYIRIEENHVYYSQVYSLSTPWFLNFYAPDSMVIERDHYGGPSSQRYKCWGSKK